MNKISNDRIMIESKDLVIIIPQKNPHFSPLDCPMCNLTISDSDDVKSYIEWKACRNCFVDWVEPRKAKWLAGLRPSFDEIQKHQNKTKTIPTLSVSFEKYNY